jgi:ubiquinone/menaquinone biosynthesis C-methylase UbiE
LADWLRTIRTFFPQAILGPVALLYEKLVPGGLCDFYRQVALEITSSVKAGKVLDVGTGPGHLLVEITRCNPNLELVGLDLSPSMLKIAKKLTGQYKMPVQLVRGNVRSLPFSDDTFDLVVSTLSFHHWRDPAEGIRQCLRVTVPGGRCWIYDLRTDVAAKTHASLLTGKGFGRVALSWITKFHGVNPRHYQADTVSSWLAGAETVKVEVYPAYLKLKIGKAAHNPPTYKSQGKVICAKSTSSENPAALST